MTGTREEDVQTAGTPRWVKLFAIIALLVIGLVVILLVSGRGGPHSPRRHAVLAETAASQTVGQARRPAGVMHG